MSEFPGILRALRLRLDLSQSELGKAIGKSRSTIAMYESGEREPSFEVMESIADFFNVDMNYLHGVESSISIIENNLVPVINEDEKDLIINYRKLCRDKQMMLKGYLEHMVHEAEAAEAAKQIKDA